MTNTIEVLKAAPEIPADILEAARKVTIDDLGMDIPGKMQDGYIGCIADAILAERARCAEIAAAEGRGFRNEGLPQPALGCFHVRRAILGGAA